MASYALKIVFTGVIVFTLITKYLRCHSRQHVHRQRRYLKKRRFNRICKIAIAAGLDYNLICMIVWKVFGSVTINQKDYAEDVIMRFDMKG